MNLSGVQHRSVKSFQSSVVRLIITKCYLSLALRYTVLKYGNKSRLRKDARSLASSQPLSLCVHGWKEASNDGYYGNHIFINAHPHEICFSIPHPPNCNKVTEKASLLPRV